MELRGRKLTVPIDGYNPEQMKGAFYQGRVGHIHHAADLLAPRNTPIRAVENGTIGRLFESAAGGLTIYQKDPSGRFVYYYAHLESYAEGLTDGASVNRGQVIGYVGTSGNAPPNTPHLHFAISVVGPGGSVFKGQPVDPYEVYSRDSSVVGNGPANEKTDTIGQPSSIANQFPTKLPSGNSGDRGTVIKSENKSISIKEPGQSNAGPPLAKRQIINSNPAKLPPLAPPIRKIPAANMHSSMAKPPPQKIPAKDRSKVQKPKTESKKLSKFDSAKSTPSNSTLRKSKSPKSMPLQSKPKSRPPIKSAKVSAKQKLSKSSTTKPAAQKGSARTKATVSKNAPKRSPTKQLPAKHTAKKSEKEKPATRVTKTPPSKAPSRKTASSITSKKTNPTRKSSNTKKVVKPSKPQKTPVVLRKLNKASTPKTRTVR